MSLTYGNRRALLLATTSLTPPPGAPSTDFTQPSNSQYVPLLFEDF